ncbi:MmpS family transport accessory protein [Mycobacterium spongiae]|uniref:Uncharacterized protein n=1 Tax=Mycobacterium spongiae TaxID=886343 RepID=A0A975K1D7_9MYCO|nr:MmpS family transport accessory protein [Mycobacterium spongiae]QUR68348.1 hypothetical protein F6B93_15800 [Mycobacterium spongiae]
MTDPRRHQRFGPPQAGFGPTGPAAPRGSHNPSTTDPAYADQASYGPAYEAQIPQWAPGPYQSNPPPQPPPYWPQDPSLSDEPTQPGQAPSPPQGPKSPRWLWVAAGAAVLLVVSLVIALVIANGSARRQTAVAPLPAMPGPNSTVRTPTTTSTPSPSAAPAPTTTSSPGAPTDTTGPAAMQTVVYSVSGEGRAISVTYIDTGNVIQTEFNVELPWSKQVRLSESAIHPANVTIVNIGHNVTCSITVAGVQVRQRTGMGLTICDAS